MSSAPVKCTPRKGLRTAYPRPRHSHASPRRSGRAPCCSEKTSSKVSGQLSLCTQPRAVLCHLQRWPARLPAAHAAETTASSTKPGRCDNCKTSTDTRNLFWWLRWRYQANRCKNPTLRLHKCLGVPVPHKRWYLHIQERSVHKQDYSVFAFLFKKCLSPGQATNDIMRAWAAVSRGPQRWSVSWHGNRALPRALLGAPAGWAYKRLSYCITTGDVKKNQAAKSPLGLNTEVTKSI